MEIAALSSDLRRFLWSDSLISSIKFSSLAHDSRYPLANDLLSYSILSVIAIALIRILLDIAIFKPIVQYFLADNKPKGVPFASKELEALYIKRRWNLPDINEVKELSGSLKLDIVKINKWIKSRQELDRFEIKLTRCKECLFRLAIYSLCFFAGYQLIKADSSCYSNADTCLKNMFKIPPTIEEKYYFVILQIPLYIYLSFSHIYEFHQHSRSTLSLAFCEMFSHHILVASLLICAYFGNFLKVTIVGLVLHDVTDLFMETSKLLNYFRLHNTSLLMFFVLVPVWGYSRLYLFSQKIMKPLLLDGAWDKSLGQVKLVFVGIVVSVFLLNVYWFMLIIRLCYRIAWGGVDTKRDRALTELSTDDESEFEADDDENDTSGHKSKKNK